MKPDFLNKKGSRYALLGAGIFVCALIALLIRIVPMYTLAGTGDMIAGPDAWYNLRLAEVAVENGLSHLSFEPMTLFPTGQDIVWGPLFTWVSAIVALIAGASTRVDLITAVSWIPAIMGACMVPVMYFLGKKLGDRKTGILAALFIAVIGGTYLSRSLYGHFDHHIAETLFSTLFCLCYVVSLIALRDHAVDFKKVATLKLPIIYGAICGVAYLLGLMTMATMVVFGLFVSIFTLIQFIIDAKEGKPTEYLLSLNAVTFFVAAVGLLVYGIKDASMSFYNYSLGLFLAHIAVIVGTAVLYLILKLIKKSDKPWYYYPMSLAILIVAGLIVCAVALPGVFSQLLMFFSTNATSATIAEMQSWSFESAVGSYNWGVLLAVIGFVYLAYKAWKERAPAVLFVLVWTALMFVATCSHIRWEYYFAANTALLAAAAVSWAISFCGKDAVLFVKSFKNKKPEPQKTAPAKKSGKAAAKNNDEGCASGTKIALLVVALIAGTAFFAVSAVNAYDLSSKSVWGDPNQYWEDATLWLEENTPEPGIDYDTVYDKNGFEYPKEAYGVLSWWDYGHYITAIGKRIPNANPFQSGVSGEYGVAQVLVSQNETETCEKFDYLGSKYVMTDYIMANDIFAPITIWADSEKQIKPYYYNFLSISDGMYQYNYAQSPDYYNTLVAKLQMFDGSYVKAGDVYVVFTETNVNYGVPAITSTKHYDDATEAWAVADSYNSNSANTIAGKKAFVVAAGTLPSKDVPALSHFRLVYESKPYYTGMSYVKTFEYVKGAVIKGEGTIELNLVTNQGREFKYTQKSVGGKFVVPYATGDNGDVKASGVYKIVESGKTFSVSEDAVQNGLSIN